MAERDLESSCLHRPSAGVTGVVFGMKRELCVRLDAWLALLQHLQPFVRSFQDLTKQSQRLILMSIFLLLLPEHQEYKRASKTI